MFLQLTIAYKFMLHKTNICIYDKIQKKETNYLISYSFMANTFTITVIKDTQLQPL